MFQYLNEISEEFAAIAADQPDPAEGGDGQREVGGQQADDEGQNDLPEKRCVKVGKDEVDGEGQDQEDVGDSAADGVHDGGGAVLKKGHQVLS